MRETSAVEFRTEHEAEADFAAIGPVRLRQRLPYRQGNDGRVAAGRPGTAAAAAHTEADLLFP